MGVYVGLDCGGSSCRALGVTATGDVVHQGQAGPANILSTPRGRLKENLRRALEGCPPADVVCGCFAGLLTQADRDLAHHMLEDVRELPREIFSDQVLLPVQLLDAAEVLNPVKTYRRTPAMPRRDVPTDPSSP